MVLFYNAIDQPTLDAMMTATRNAFPDFQRYLKARAQALGLPKLAWYDRLVPLGQGTQSWAYADATSYAPGDTATFFVSSPTLDVTSSSRPWSFWYSRTGPHS